ncbi:HAD family hydrolase [Saccharothrix mutabilis subsp. capreolus]|nr:HAD family hydrolase [Saccharothrix mutabilis subsp. capreolus]
MHEAAKEVLGRAKAVLLDFDGPVCSVFAGHPADQVASDLVELLRRRGTSIPAELGSESDPMEVLRWSGIHSPENLIAVEDRLIHAECVAVESAEQTVGVGEVMHSIVASGRSVAVVSNNCEAAIAKYLGLHGLGGLPAFISGRAYADPALMKPNPHSLHVAIKVLGVSPADVILIGDTTSDVAASIAAGVKSIGYANKPGKAEALSLAGADAVVDSMAFLL